MNKITLMLLKSVVVIAATAASFATQAAIMPPKFVIFASDWVEASYRRFIERRLREEFGFDGSPVEVALKIKERDQA